VAVPPLKKPEFATCTHCAEGVGCRVYTEPERPQACGDWKCLWLEGKVPLELKPDACGAVFFEPPFGARNAIAVQVDARVELDGDGPVMKHVRRLLAEGVAVSVARCEMGDADVTEWHFAPDGGVRTWRRPRYYGISLRRTAG
jgi:hypothetical protein